MSEKKLFFLVLIILFLVTQGVYLLTLLPDIGWGDSPELITTAYTLGVSHPTGYPLYTQLTHLFSIVGSNKSAAWRVNYFSALSSSLAVLVLYFILFRYFLADFIKNKYKTIIAGSGSLLFAFSFIYWSQSITAEVYSFHILLMLLVLLAILEWTNHWDERYLFTGIFLLGMAFTHHLLTVILLPFIIFILFNKKDDFLNNKPKILYCLAFCFLGYIGILYLVIRSAHFPVMNWGNVQTFPAFIDMLSGGQFKLRMASTNPGLGMGNKHQYLNIMTNDLLGFVASLWGQFVPRQMYYGIVSIWLQLLLNLSIIGLSIFGLITLYTNKRLYFWAILLVFVANIIIIANYQIVDIESYYLPAILVFVIWFTIGLAKFMDTLVIKFPSFNLIYSLIFLGVAFISLFSNYLLITRSQNLTGYYYGKNTLESVEDNALIITGGDNDIFPLWYWKYVHQLKPNVTVFGGNFLSSPWYKSYFQNKGTNFNFTIVNGLYKSQQEWADALTQNIILTNSSNRPVYTTFYDPFVSKVQYFVPIGSFIPDAARLPEAPFLFLIKLYRLYNQTPDFFNRDTSVTNKFNVSFDNTIYLLECRMNNANDLHPGDVFNVDYYWKASQIPVENYSALVSYPDSNGMIQMDEKDKPLFIQEIHPISNVLPTSKWKKDVIYKESYKVMIPLLDINAGKYSMAISLRKNNSFVSADYSGNTTQSKTFICGNIEILP